MGAQIVLHQDDPGGIGEVDVGEALQDLRVIQGGWRETARSRRGHLAGRHRELAMLAGPRAHVSVNGNVVRRSVKTIAALSCPMRAARSSGSTALPQSTRWLPQQPEIAWLGDCRALYENLDRLRCRLFVRVQRLDTKVDLAHFEANGFKGEVEIEDGQSLSCCARNRSSPGQGLVEPIVGDHERASAPRRDARAGWSAPRSNRDADKPAAGRGPSRRSARRRRVPAR